MSTEVQKNLKHLTTIIEYFFLKKDPSVKNEVPDDLQNSKIYLCTEATIYLIIQTAKQLQYTNPYITLLNHHKYIIDEEGNVTLFTEKENITLQGKELLALLRELENKQYQAIFTYTKFTNSIQNEKILEDYLNQVKTFLILMSSTSSNPNFSNTFKSTSNIVKEEYREKKEVKTNDLITSFQKRIAPPYQVTIKKMHLTNAEKKYICQRIKEYEIDFYSLALEEQQTLLETWILDYKNSNRKNVLIAQKNILTMGKEEVDSEKLDCILIGLIILYGRILKKQNEIDYDSISLSNIEISTYDSESIQQKKEKIAELQRKIEEYKKNNARCEQEKKIADLEKKISHMDNELQAEERTALEIRKQRLQKELSMEEQKNNINLFTKRNLDADLRIEMLMTKLEIMTNNNLKMQELCKNLEDGIVKISGKNSQISITNTNPNTGRIIFEVHISLENMFEIIKCIENKLESLHYIK